MACVRRSEGGGEKRLRRLVDLWSDGEREGGEKWERNSNSVYIGNLGNGLSGPLWASPFLESGHIIRPSPKIDFGGEHLVTSAFENRLFLEAFFFKNIHLY